MDVKQIWEEVNSSLMPQYGTSMHYPYCQQHNCTGCMQAFDPEEFVRERANTLDLSIFREE